MKVILAHFVFVAVYGGALGVVFFSEAVAAAVFFSEAVVAAVLLFSFPKLLLLVCCCFLFRSYCCCCVIVFFSKAVAAAVLFSLQCVSSSEHNFSPTKRSDAQPLVENEKKTALERKSKV